MDGISQTRTLGGVVLGAAAAAGSAVYKVYTMQYQNNVFEHVVPRFTIKFNQ